MQKKIFFVDGLINRSAAQVFQYLGDIISDGEDYETFFLCPADTKVKWPFVSQPKNLKRIWSDGHYVMKLREFFRVNNPSVIHFFFELRTFGSLKSAIKFPLLLFFLRKEAKIVLTVYNPFMTRKETGWSLVEDIPLKFPRFAMKIFAKLFVKAICNYSHKIVVQNNVIKLCLVEYFGIRRDKIVVIKNAVLLDKQSLDQEKKEKFLKKFSGKKVILYFGVISPRKGQQNAIRAFNRIKEKLPEHVLVIAGRTSPEFKSYESELKRTIEELDLQNRVFLVGYLQNDEINALFDIADMTLWTYLPSITGSGAFSFALQYHKPSIVTNVDTFKEILGDEGALFVEPENENQLATSILKLATDQELRDKLKEEMKIIANSRSCTSVAAKHFDIYQTMLRQ